MIAASSSQGIDAAYPGVEVYSGDELMPEYGPLIGKGDAMWRALSIARGDLVVYTDVEAPAFKPHFVLGVLGPILNVLRVRFVKATYERPVGCAQDFAEPEVDDALAELINSSSAPQPLLPRTVRISQLLSGEFAASRELLRFIPFFTGHTTEMTIMIGILNKVGPDAMAQVNFGIRSKRGRFLSNPGCESYAMLRAVDLRLDRDSFGRPPSEEAHPRGRSIPAMVASYTRPVSSWEGVRLGKDTAQIAERSLMTRVLQATTRANRSDIQGL